MKLLARKIGSTDWAEERPPPRMVKSSIHLYPSRRNLRSNRGEMLRIRISRYLSYLLRHNPEGLRMDERGFVSLAEVLSKLRKRFPQVTEGLIREIVERSDRRRFEIKDGKIRALYGHSIPVKLDLKEDDEVKVLYHGTTQEAAGRILRTGLKPMRRNWVHLSPTVEIAKLIGLRRTSKPVILEVDAEKARRNGVKFYRATDEIYLCREVPPSCIRLLARARGERS